MMPVPRFTVSQPVTAAVLAGGRGSRMGGADKGLLRLRGVPLVRHVLSRVPESVPALIVANRNHAAYRALGWPVVMDPWPDFRGPLAGMLAALRAARTPWVQMLPCDGARLPADLIDVLLGHATKHQVQAVYPVTHGQGHFTCALLHQDLKLPLEAALEDDERAPRHWLANVGARPVQFPDPEHALVWSLNDEVEFARASRRAGSGAPTWV